MSTNVDTVQAGSSDPPSTQVTAPSSAPSPSSNTGVSPDQSNSVPAQSAPASTPRSNVADSKTPSLTSPKAVANSQQPTPTQSQSQVTEDPVKHLRDELSRRGREMAQMRSDHERVAKEAAEMRKHFDQQRQQAEQSKLNRWDPKHPDNTKFKDVRSRIAKAQQDVRSLRAPEPPPGLSPEHQAAWRGSYIQSRKAELASQFDDKDIEDYQAWEADKADYLERLHEDPRSAQRETIRDELRAMLQEERATAEASQLVESDLSDPDLAPMMKQYGGEMMDVINRLGGTDESYDVAKHMMLLFADNQKKDKLIAEYSQRQGSMSQQVAEAKTKNDLVKRRASITVDQRPPVSRPPFIEAKEWAEKNGHSLTSDAFQKKVTDLTLSRHNITTNTQS